MWQSIPRTGSLLLRAPRPHSFQRFPRCLLSSLHASLPALSVSPLPPLSSLHAKLPASSGFPAASSLLPPCCSPCVQRFTRCLLSSLHASLPASSGLPAASSPPTMPRSLRSAVSCCLLSPPSMLLSLRPAVYPLSLSPPDPVSPPLKHNKIS